MTRDEVIETIRGLFEDTEGEYLKFARIPEAERLHRRPDLCGMLYLDRLFPFEPELSGEFCDMVGSAEHDEVWLENLPWGWSDAIPPEAVPTREDIVYLVRCGIRWDRENDSFAMYV